MEGKGDREEFVSRELAGSYRILRRIGSGGSGTVFLTQHLPTGQLRAAKAYRNAEDGSRMRELAMLRRLHHPGLPQIFDIIEAEKQTWLIMEYISGRDLGKTGSENLNAMQFFDIAVELADVLMYLHTRHPPVLHLDIKPSNLMIRSSGKLVLLDFGAAVSMEKDGEKSLCIGTPGFAAPEQKKRGETVDLRTDIYGYGATLYWLLYGKMPEALRAENNKWADHGHRGVPLWKKRMTRVIGACIRQKKKERIADSRKLYRMVYRERARYVGTAARRGRAAAVIFLMFAGLFAVQRICSEWVPGEWTTEKSSKMDKKSEDRYEMLLETADSMGFDQAVGCYREAAMIRPVRYTWCEHLLERILEDYQFSLQEESSLRELLFTEFPGEGGTAAERMRSNPELYGYFSYRLGIGYWYFYEGSGGKRAAASWFARAVSLWDQEISETEEARHVLEQEKGGSDDLPDWLPSAVIHAKISSYYEKIGRLNENAEESVRFSSYWSDLKELWELETFQQEPSGIRFQVAEELLSGMVLHMSELREDGISSESAGGLLEKLKTYVQEECQEDRTAGEDGEEEAVSKVSLEKLCEEAEAAADRVYR